MFVGRSNGFDVYKSAEIETAQSEPKPLVSVSLKGQLRWLAVSCEGLTVLASIVADGKTDNCFYDVRGLAKERISLHK